MPTLRELDKDIKKFGKNSLNDMDKSKKGNWKNMTNFNLATKIYGNLEPDDFEKATGKSPSEYYDDLSIDEQVKMDKFYGKAISPLIVDGRTTDKYEDRRARYTHHLARQDFVGESNHKVLQYFLLRGESMLPTIKKDFVAKKSMPKKTNSLKPFRR